MMAGNDRYFSPPMRDQTYLRVRGFDAEGRRSGGIINPQLVELRSGTVLVRLYHDRSKRFGEWWSTPHELRLVTEYFARSGPAFATGRTEGKGILHATLAVRHDWSGNSPLHLGQFFVVRLAESLKAYHGEGDHAPDASQRQVQKAVRITDSANRQRFARQIFLPRPWEYERAFVVMHEGTTDTGLPRALTMFDRGPLPFET
jgi:hypothetical protein